MDVRLHHLRGILDPLRSSSPPPPPRPPIISPIPQRTRTSGRRRARRCQSPRHQEPPFQMGPSLAGCPRPQVLASFHHVSWCAGSQFRPQLASLRLSLSPSVLILCVHNTCRSPAARCSSSRCWAAPSSRPNSQINSTLAAHA